MLMLEKMTPEPPLAAAIPPYIEHTSTLPQLIQVAREHIRSQFSINPIHFNHMKDGVAAFLMTQHQY